MSPALQRALALWVVLLVAVLLLPLPHLATVLILLAALVLLAGVMAVTRRPAGPQAGLCADDLPDVAYRQPVVLVCGDSAHAWPEGSAVLTVPHGCWVRVADHQALDVVARQLLSLRPEWGHQLSVMISVCPQQHQDSDTLASRLLALRWQIGQLRRETGYSLPLVLNAQVGSALVSESLWQVRLAGEPVSVWSDSAKPTPPECWLAAGGGIALQQQVLINSLTEWFQQEVIRVLTDSHPDMPAATPAGMVWGLSASLDGALATSLWTRWLQQHTALVQVAGWCAPEVAESPLQSMLPEFVLPLLPAGHGLTPRQRTWRGALWLALTVGIVALCCSAWNNHRLLQRVSFDIAHYARIAMNDYAVKAAAVNVLRRDARELDEHARNGAPLRLGLGLYQGGHLRLPLLDAIRSYIPPPPPPPEVVKEAPKTVRLDSLSLFASGKSVLKPGSLKMLVNALVDIKARPGWLIVVAGHTDSTGNAQANQQLSLKRAEALRDWMLSTSDVSPTCFAVQGFGASRPMATNDTPEGRALNRRVEISLVPQADACLAAATRTSSQDDDTTVSPK